MLKTVIRKNAYYDSVTLMLVTDAIKKIDGVEEALVGMGTDTNKGFLKDLGMLTAEIEETNPNDLLIVVKGDETAMDEVLEKVEELLKGEKEETSEERIVAHSLDEALSKLPDANMVLISIAGEYAGREADKALERGLNVMLFSDNVPLDEEIRLKKKALKRGLLVMGPDCGTAIINGVPLAFANVVKRGKIGVVAASGTGAQEVSSIISNLGGGISQLIGTGGRDVKKDVGGLMFLEGIKRLIEDEETEIIVLVSKPPAPEVTKKAVELLKNSGKPGVVHFVNGKVEDPDVIVGKTLEDTAIKAYLLWKGEKIEKDTYTLLDLVDVDVDELIESEKNKISGKYIRGLYSGGTLADEAMVLLSEAIGPIWSPTPLVSAYTLDDPNASKEHTIVDMGDDVFTRGRPHPMIDFTMRKERLIKEYNDPDVAIILVDVVLGYGSHMNPGNEIAEAIKEARVSASKYTSVIVNICGTYNDPQNYEQQKKTLEESGAIVFPSNASAVNFAIKLYKGLI